MIHNKELFVIGFTIGWPLGIIVFSIATRIINTIKSRKDRQRVELIATAYDRALEALVISEDKYGVREALECYMAIKELGKSFDYYLTPTELGGDDDKL